MRNCGQWRDKWCSDEGHSINKISAKSQFVKHEARTETRCAQINLRDTIYTTDVTSLKN